MKLAVFLDSSVIIAAMGSETGGSHRVLQYCHEGRVKGFINQTVLEEVYRRAGKVGFPQKGVEKFMTWVNATVLPPPSVTQVQAFSSVVADPNDAHLFASACRIPNCRLISLDKRHVLPLKNEVKGIKITSPAEFLQTLV